MAMLRGHKRRDAVFDVRSASVPAGDALGDFILRTHAAIAAGLTAGTFAALTVVPAQGAEYSYALKVRGIQYDALGRRGDRPVPSAAQTCPGSVQTTPYRDE
ncbi:hypothetical protein [Streptomyces sp. NBC_00353]|uniref:hypothetical protein n=1 Tax=Streptomyces sp. NBC_00353 TaxID=2975722 RepID=UPI003FA7A7DA